MKNRIIFFHLLLKIKKYPPEKGKMGKQKLLRAFMRVHSIPFLLPTFLLSLSFNLAVIVLISLTIFPFNQTTQLNQLPLHFELLLLHINNAGYNFLFIGFFSTILTKFSLVIYFTTALFLILFCCC